MTKIPLGQVTDPWWDDAPVYVIGGGTSLEGFDFAPLKHLGKTVGANKSAFVAETDVLFSLDQLFVRRERDKIQRYVEDGGEAYLAMPVNEDGHKPVEGATYIIRNRGNGLSEHPDRVNGMNSGYGALNLAFLKRAKEIALLGFDMRYGQNNSHFHGGYSWHLNVRHNMMRNWVNGFATTYTQLHFAGVNVVNYIGDPPSRIDTFPKRPLSDLV